MTFGLDAEMDLTKLGNNPDLCSKEALQAQALSQGAVPPFPPQPQWSKMLNLAKPLRTRSDLC